MLDLVTVLSLLIREGKGGTTCGRAAVALVPCARRAEEVLTGNPSCGLELSQLPGALIPSREAVVEAGRAASTGCQS